ncbi:MAG: hypothetical protein JWM58_3682 [Rhizobium sp.]|nr:hypothetical protein [Rhizobium sp.]
MANAIRVSRSSFLLSAGALIALSNVAAAQTTTEAKPDVTCLQTPAKMSDSDLQAFIGDPKALLTANPMGGLPLSSRVRELAGSSSNAFQKIMELTKDASDGQKSAIAAGLASVVSVCDGVGTDAAQGYASVIQTAVANSGDAQFASTFQVSSKDVSAASVSPGAGDVAVGGGATDDGGKQASGTNLYKSPGDGPLDTTSNDYAIGGHMTSFSATTQ